jgi:hypothetical protein
VAHANLRKAFEGFQGVDYRAVEKHFAGGWLFEAADHAQSCGLAAAERAEEDLAEFEDGLHSG